MKIIFAIVREERLAFVQRSLADVGVYGMTVKHVSDGRIFVLPIEQSARVRTGEVEV